MDTTDLRYVVEDTGQLMDEQPQLAYPCALIAIDTSDWQSVGANLQLGVLQISVTVIDKTHVKPSSNKAQSSKEKGLSFYELEHNVHKTLQGWSPEYMVIPEGEEDAVDALINAVGSLDRTTAKPNKSWGGLNIRQITYTLGVEDNSTLRVQQYEPVTPAFTFDFEIDVEDLEL